MILEKGHVDVRSELWGEKWVSLKPTLATLTIAWSHDSITHGHINTRWGKELTLTGSTSEYNPTTLINPNLVERLLFYLMIS
jgi:hypothetical protein